MVQLLVLLSVNFVSVHAVVQTYEGKMLPKHSRSKMCSHLCQASEDSFSVMKEYLCHRVSENSSIRSNYQSFKKQYTCINSQTSHANARCILDLQTTENPRRSGRHGSTCQTNFQCRFPGAFCHEGLCHCRVGFYFDPKKNICVKKCQAYDDVMTAYIRYSISKYNHAYIYNVSLAECLQRCRCETSFLCLSAEWGIIIRNCHLSKSGYYDVPRKYRWSKDFGHYLGQRTRCK